MHKTPAPTQCQFLYLLDPPPCAGIAFRATCIGRADKEPSVQHRFICYCGVRQVSLSQSFRMWLHLL